MYGSFSMKPGSLTVIEKSMQITPNSVLKSRLAACGEAALSGPAATLLQARLCMRYRNTRTTTT
ncbi:hypothetical protein B0I35DRAFT_441792 [Stachybotrys elegans]|uniref:Uncharacterized protein n=1 Tax=Stachybotrys elegans TaxID=80388 RepID=A0A8K0WLP6_9HYPO|nr:hypothetical protein B0I35DRAFT_441792 [Stachybotrys elegans]